MAGHMRPVHILTETESFGTFSPQNLRQLIIEAFPLARASISATPRVAIGRGSSGRNYVGVNVELRHLPLHHSIHAEQFLVANLALKNEQELRYLAITANGKYFHAPCGHCCQFLHEIRDVSNTQILVTDITCVNGSYAPLSTFLPQTFSPYNIVPANITRLLEPRDNGLTLIEGNAVGEVCDDLDSCNYLQCWALSAANRAYAPYSKCPSGVALRDGQGKMYKGWYMESEALNPSLGPVQAALVDFVLNGQGQGFDQIVEAMLVEKGSGVVSQEDTAKMIIEKIANSTCRLRVLHCH